jgi:hypothetical protein
MQSDTQAYPAPIYFLLLVDYSLLDSGGSNRIMHPSIPVLLLLDGSLLVASTSSTSLFVLLISHPLRIYGPTSNVESRNTMLAT